MDIPTDVLEKLKCGKCGLYLSRGPVYLQHDGAALCGRCYTSKLPATRNTQYEAVASLLRFPCKYSELGCDDTVPYVQEDEVIAHEEVCAHRHWVCPVLGSARCDWLGLKADILQHCQDRHPDRVLDNPCHLEHNITRFSERTFILRDDQLLFLLHTKVCVTSAKIYHSVRLIGDSDSASMYKFIVDIKRGKRLISLPGDVAPQGCLAIQKDTSLAIDTNCLLGMLGGFAGTSFTVEVKRRVREAMEVCTECEAQGMVLVYRSNDGGWLCESCAPARRACENQVQGCSHQDIDMKCRKHERYFCQQRTQCLVCDAAVDRGSWTTHHLACLAVCRVGSTWRATWTKGQRCLVSSAAGTAVCGYRMNDRVFELRVRIPVSSERLREFRCVVRVTQPATGLERTYTPDTLYDEVWDWNIEVDEEEFPTWDCVFDVLVDISEIDI